MRFYVHGRDERFEAVSARFKEYGVNVAVCDCFCQGGTGLVNEVYVKPSRMDRLCWERLKSVVEENQGVSFYVVASDQLQIAGMRNVIGGKGNLSFLVEAEFGEQISVRLQMAKSRSH